MKSKLGDAAISDEQLQRYFDGELGPVERGEVEARLDADARLRLEALSELRGLLRAQAQGEEEQVDLSALSATIDAIGRQPQTAVVAQPKRRWIPMSAAGAFLAAAAAVMFLVMPRAPSRVSGGNHAVVESLEVEGSLATVFHVTSGDDEATIIWADGESDNAVPTE
jgi:anti-sigma factor RsiW